MLAVIQRVTQASVSVDQLIIGEIQQGILALIGIEKADTEKNADRLLERILSYRIFNDAADKMNLSLKDIQGGLLLVSQFTIVADTQNGTRPGFSVAMPPEEGKLLFEYMTKRAIQSHATVACGRFGANMQISLCNDGPVTFLLKA